jgi:hypothetical protein
MGERKRESRRTGDEEEEMRSRLIWSAVQLEKKFSGRWFLFPLGMVGWFLIQHTG